MRKFGLLFFALATGAVLTAGFNSGVNAGALSLMFGSDHIDRSSSLVVKIKKKKHNEGNQGERSCPAGYVVLEKPNKYGSFCEPKDGLPAPAPAEAEKCKFGMIGTPPNDCRCPEHTEFEGYKGCVRKAEEKYCRDYSYEQAGERVEFLNLCRALNRVGECNQPPHTSYLKCCCHWYP
jgi:hypothetical protein